MKKLIKRNIESVLSSSPVDETDISVKNIITQLNQHRFIIVSGSTVLNSASYIHTTIIKSNIKENCFYFDASLDYNHKVQNHKILFQLIDDFFSHNTSKTKLIVLK
ncbi:MAG: hypothetical protein H6767_03015 [Candidatus Peribacteria bacterium]|nr:MAG: hypothetical protein H6767_03015 [Candidatus Peribacteria bacterium]